ncbi:MAG: hypothetical protein EP330_12940 [Deltaproteobacteria bacterium]|nr:MAG: hypothetical protein EP330_12940 [Deltaproteobacteria bacterium]
MRAWPILAALVLTACGVKQDDYPVRFAEAYCEWAVVEQCVDSAVLEFNGWTDMDTCVPSFGGRYEAQVSGCVYDKKAAGKCLKEMKKHPCGDGETLPESCELAYICQNDSGM